MRSHWYDRTSERYLKYLKSREWLALRRQVIERCGDKCERCGKFSVAEVHHLTYDRVYHEALEDLQGLCGHCHAFLHGERTDDGAAEYERQVKREEEDRRRVERAHSELRRLEEKPEVYRTYARNSFPSHRELIALLRQYPRFVFGSTEGLIFDVRRAKRKYEAAVTFKVRWDIIAERIFSWKVVKSAEALLYAGKLLFDTEREMWVDVESVRGFVQRYGSQDGDS